MQRYHHYSTSYSSFSPSSTSVEEVHVEEVADTEETVYGEGEEEEEEEEEELQPMVQKTGGIGEEAVPLMKEDVTPAVSETEAKTQPVDSKNGKRTGGGGGGGEGDARGDAQGGPKYSMFTWIVVLGLLGVWSSVAIVYFDIVDYDSVIGGPQPLCKNLLWFQASLHGCPLEK